ncbi:hypothetical protein TorRG33x02_056460 [Trema orientale]|uniref:Uncharacterized protein n=1 Tax=Trema orientale TaxID=63057 RepID=A0A2P5FKT7_TREOI|nr:hypothetical protein TorRG33x02_056460 [Trema orientale]
MSWGLKKRAINSKDRKLLEETSCFSSALSLIDIIEAGVEERIPLGLSETHPAKSPGLRQNIAPGNKTSEVVESLNLELVDETSPVPLIMSSPNTTSLSDGILESPKKHCTSSE